MNMLKLFGILVAIIIISATVSAMVASRLYNKRGERKQKTIARTNKLLELEE